MRHYYVTGLKILFLNPDFYFLRLEDFFFRKKSFLSVIGACFLHFYEVRKFSKFLNHLKFSKVSSLSKKKTYSVQSNFYHQHHQQQPQVPGPFICPYCQRSFKREKYLRFHLNAHAGYKPYMCNVCGKSFGRVSILRFLKKSKNF